MNHDTFHGNVLTDIEALSALVDSAKVSPDAFLAYKAGYYESTHLTLMARFPEVRKEINQRAIMATWKD